MAISNNFTEKYNYDDKAKWREWIYSEIKKISFNYYEGKLHGKWLEPIGTDAACFKQLLGTNLIDESQLIGIDCDPANRKKSKNNINKCKELFKLASFYELEWDSFCYKYEQSDISYIIYDLFTSTHGTKFFNNLEACCQLIEHSLKYQDQIILVINSDIKVMKRHNKTFDGFNKNLNRLFEGRQIGLPYINIENIYEYKNTNNSDNMGSILLSCCKKITR